MIVFPTWLGRRPWASGVDVFTTAWILGSGAWTKVVVTFARARPAGGAGRAGGRSAVRIDRAWLRHGDGARAGRIRVGMAAVPDPATDSGQAIAAAGPGEEWILADLPLDLELPCLLAVRSDVAGA